RSGGRAVTLGALEPLDLVSAVDYLTTRDDIDQNRIGALGLSLGAATTILAAADDRRIGAVVADSSFSGACSGISSSFQHFIGLPAFPFDHHRFCRGACRHRLEASTPHRRSRADQP